MSIKGVSTSKKNMIFNLVEKMLADYFHIWKLNDQNKKIFTIQKIIYI